MNFRTTTTAILFLVAVSAFGQRYEKMLRTRTLSNHTIVGAEFHSSSNSVFILTNVTNSNGDGLLIKVNALNGDTIWSKYVASSSQSESYKGLYVSGSGLYAYGYRQHANLEYPFLVKLTTDGDTLWTRHYRTIPWTTSSSCANSPGVVNGLVELATGELVLVGRNNNCDRAFLLKTTSAGVISSVKEYDSWVTGQYSPIQEFFDVREHSGNLYVLYRSYGPNATNQNVPFKGVFKLNNAGDTIRHYHLSINHQNSDVFDLQLDQNSNMFVAGRQYLGQNNYGFIEKLNSSGVSQWVYSPSAATIQWSAISDLQVDASGNVLGSGYFQKSGQSVDQFVVKVLANGTESWLKQYGYGDNGWGRELVQVGNNYALISYESFCWSSYKYGFRYNNSPPCTDHVVIQMMNSSGELGRFYAPPQQSEKQGRLKFFKTVSFNFETQEWTNVSVIPVSLTSPTGGSALYNSQNSNTNFSFQNSSTNYNGEGTFYFQASDKNGDVRFSDTLEVMPDPSFSVFDQFGNNSLVACMGDSLQLSVDNINVGSTYKWFYEGVNGTSAAIRIATGASKYVKLSGYYKVREILASGDSANTSSKVLSIQTQKVKITSSSYPQTFYVSGSASDSLNRANPPILNWTQNRNLQHWIAPFGRFKEYNVQQYYYTAADLSSRGLKANSLIDEVAFVLNQSYSSGSSLEDFKISARWTTNTVNSWITMTGSDVVLDSYWQSPSASAGRKSFNINDLTWDGTRSLVIQVSYRVNSFNSASDINPIFKLEESSINVSRLIQSSTAITLLSNPGTSGVKPLKFRPLTEFKISLPAKNDTIVGCTSSIPLTVSNTGYQSLTWDNNSISSSRTVTSAGLRWVQMIDANFCLSNDTVQVIFSPNTNSITASNDTAVVGSSVTLSAASAYLNLWSNGSTGNSINASNTGTYTLTSINADGCSVKDSVKVTILDLPQIRIGRPAKYTGEVITGYTYMGKIGERHVYLANNCGSISSAQSAISNLKGEFWYPRTAAENSEINSIYKSKEGCCGELWIPVNRSSVGQPWKYLNGTAASYTNWDVNYNVNGLYAFINFGWNGFWNATTSATDCRKYFVSFSDNSTAAGANESVCDSAFLWTKAGFDSYEWRKDGTVISGNTNSILSNTSGIYAVKGIRATTSYNGLSSVNLSINPSPLVSIANLSGTVDLTGSNSIKLKAIYPSGSSVQWFVNGVAQSPGQDSVVSNTVGWHRLVVTLNGCTSMDSVRFSQPIFVAKTGNNQTGNGTLGLPYLTIQKGVDMATNEGKVYVLPGNYVESVNITKPIILASNYFRLGHLGAVDSTKITSSNGAYSVRVTGNFSSDSSTSKIVGFTLTGKSVTGSGEGAFTIKDLNGAPSGSYLVKQVKITGNSMPCCDDWSGSAIQSTGHNVHLIVQGGEISANNIAQQDHRGVIATNRNLTFDGVRIVDNFASQGIFKISEAPRVDFVNCLIAGNVVHWNGHSLFTVPGWGGTEPKLNFIHSTIADNETGEGKLFLRDGLADVRFLNSIWKNTTIVQNGVFQSTGKVSGVGSILPDVNILPAIKYATYHNASANIYGIYSGLNPNYSLGNTSSAIGLGAPSANLGGLLLLSVNKDINGLNRPNPAGSNPDAGAFESLLAQGNFTISVRNCGFDLIPVIANAGTNYSTKWTGPNGFTSTNSTLTVQIFGTYTLKVVSIDRNDSLTTTFNFQNPLTADIQTRDVCSAMGNSSGYLDIRNVRGGTAFSGVNIASYKWGLKLGSNYIQGPNADVWGSTWYWNSSNLSAGSYTLEFIDASGCKVEYPFVLAAKNRRKAFVSTTGNDANSGTRTSPYRTVSAAIADACGLDTIVVLDGIYIEDSIYVNKALVIGSEYLLDGNTAHIAATKFIDSDDATFFYGGFNSSSTADTISSQLVGLTIEGGRNPHVDQWYGHGGAISVWNSVVKMNRLVLKNNTAKDGGAIGLMGHGFTAVVANCTIDGNTAYSSGGGLNANLTGDLWIRNTAFTNNTANSGGGLWNQSNLIMTDVRIEGNSAQSQGGFWSSTISPWSSGTKRWTRVIVRNNVATSQFGGGYFQKSGSNSQFILDNVLIVNNASQNYPGIQFGGSDDNRISIINSTIYGNTGSGTSEASNNNIAFGDNTRIRLLNSIIGRSGGASGYTFYATNCGTKYLMADASSVIVGGATSIYEDNCGGQLVKSLTGIKSTVPYFTDPDNGDYSLKNFSSLIGAGLASNSLGITSVSPNIAQLALTATSSDVFGSARPNPSGSTIDIGAVENPLGVGVPGINVVVNGNGACQTANGSATVNLVQINGQPSGTVAISWIKLNDPTWATQTTNTISGLSSGSYRVTVTVGASAPFIDTAVVSAAPAISIVNNSLLTNCFGGNDGTLKFSIQGGSPFTGGTYKYDVQQLIKDGGVSNYTDNSTQERSANFMATLRSSGTYRISITDSKGCQFVDTITLGYRNALPTAQITASGPLTICEGETVVLNAATQNITDTYSWSDGSNLPSNTVGTSSVQIVTVTDTAGCINRDTINVVLIGTPIISTTTLNPALQVGLIRWHSFNGNINSQEDVISGATTSLVPSGNASLDLDRFGAPNSALKLDGNGDYLLSSAAGMPTSARSVSIWFNADDIGSTYSGRSVLGYGGQSCGQSWNMVIDNPAGGQNSYEVQGHCNANAMRSGYGNVHPNNTWNHWVITTSPSGTKFYLNGVLDTSFSNYVTNTVVSGKDFIIGGIPGTNGTGNWVDNNASNFKGRLDDIGVWNRELTSSEIQQLYGVTALQSSQSFCDSVVLTAPAGFNSYTWKNTSNNNSVIGTSRTQKVTMSMSVKVEGTLNKSNGTTCTLESATHNLTITSTPKTTYFTSNVRGVSNDTVTITAGISNPAAVVSWSNSQSTSNQLVTAEKGWKKIQLSLNGCTSKDSVNYQWYCDTAKFMAMGTVYLRDSIGTKMDSASMGSLLPPNYGVPVLKVTNPGSYIITSSYVYNSAAQGNGKYIIAIKQSPALSIVNLSNKVDIDSTSIKLYASRNPLNGVTWYRGSTVLGTGDTLNVNAQGFVRATTTRNGCSKSDSLMIFKPLYVSTSGSNTAGNGTWSSPYRTIQHAISQSTSGGKVYVLPGTYLENVTIDKPIQLLSNNKRLSDSTAINSTIISSPNGDFAVKFSTINGTGTHKISSTILDGFTLKGKNSSGHNAALTLSHATGGRVLVSNVNITDNSQGWGWTDVAAAISVNGGGGALLKNVRVFGNNPGKLNNPNVIWVSANSDSVVFDGCRIYDNYASWGTVAMSNAHVRIQNSLIYSNQHEDLFRFEWSPSKLLIVNSTIVSGAFTNQRQLIRYNTSSSVNIVNSVLKQSSSERLYYSSGSGSLKVRNSVLNIAPSVWGGTSLAVVLDSNVTTPQVDLTNKFRPGAKFVGYGIGVGLFEWQNVPFTAPAVDIVGNPRPLPFGSKLDVGAFESSRLIGDFDVSIENCGSSLTPIVSNAGSNYTTKWTGPNGFVSLNSVVTAPALGLYTLKVVSIDRNDSVSVTFNLINPLDFDVLTVKDVCASVSSTSGAIRFGRVRGGQPYDMAVTAWWTYQTRFVNTSGQQVQGTWHVNGNDPNWQLNQTGLTAGTYIVEVEDASGCKVQKQVVLSSKLGRKAFVSTTGLNSNAGTQSAPYATIQHAVNQSCDRDTIILLNGTYNQDSIIVNKPLIIASNYLFSGDTNDIRNTIVNGDNNRIFTYQNFSGTLSDTARSMLVGLTIQNGVTAGRGGGVWVTNQNGESVLKVNYCDIRNNYANEGGGVGADNWVRLVITNSVIRNNVASNGGGVFSHNSWAFYLRNTSIIGNSANDAGGISSSIAPYSGFENLKVVNNSSIGGTPSAYLSGNSGTTFRNIEVRGNVGGPSSNHHLRIRYDNWNSPYSGDELKISNLLMAGNVTQGWSGLYLEGGNNFSFINSTFVDNVSRNGNAWNEKGQIVLTDNVSVRLLNSIVTLSNGRSIIANGCSPGSVTIRNSAIEGGATGIQNESCAQNPFTPTLTSPNFTTAPFFVDRANGDYRLAKFSSLVGYGAVSATMATKTLTAPLVDITGAVRPQPVNTNPDVGVYEHPAGQGTPGLNLIVVGNGACQTANGSATVNLIRINNLPAGTPTISWVKLGDPTWTPQTTTSISNLTSGSYQVTLTVGSSVFIDTAVVSTAPAMSIVNNSLLTNCFGGNDGTLKFSIQGGSPFTGGTYKYDVQQLIKDGGVANYTDISTQERSANFMATLRSSGTYRISITDAKGCQFVDTITLGYRNALPTAQITANGPLTICEGEALTLTATTLNATNTYSWNDGSNLSVNTVGTSGLKIVTVTDTSGCSKSDTVVVDVKANPVVYTGTPPVYKGQPLTQDYAYLGAHNNNHYYIYKYSNTISWTQAKAISEQFGGHLWVVNDASEQAAVTSMIQTHPVYYGEAFNGAYFENGAWKWVTGEPFNYFNWATNQANNGNGTQIRVQFNWNGQWERYGYSGDQQKFIIEFPNGARNLATSEALCDSVTVSAPEGFDSYVWKNTSNNNAVVGTSRSLKVTSSMALKVEGTLNKSNNTTCTLESQTHTITINQTPAASIVNHSGTTDLYGNDTVVLGANVAAGATWTWTNAASTTSLGSNDTLLVTSPNKYVLKAVSNGCERKDSVIVDKPLFVSVTGNNSTGNGSFAAPYRTIQKGVNKAASGGKVYVLPGTYVESVVVTKPVKIYSDFERIGSTTAIAQTKITSQNGNFSIAIRMDSSGAVQNFTKQNMHISGFTIQGKNASNDMGAIDICPAPSFDWNNINKQKGEILISNIDFTNNTTQSNSASAFASRGNEVHTYFNNIKVRNSNIGVDPRGVLLFWQTKGGTFSNAQIFGNDGIIFNIDGSNMSMRFNNTAIFNNDIKGTTWGGYFQIQGNNNTLEFGNSTLSGNIMASSDARLFRTNNGSGTKVILKNSILNTTGRPVYSGQVNFEARHSLLPLTSVLALADFTYYDTTNVHSSVSRVQGYELLPNSPAIGIGSMLYATAKDIDGKNRPLPAGTNPDAGAFESGLAFGNLDLAISTCGFNATVVVLNSQNYQVTWSGPAGFSSSSLSPTLPVKGIYQVTLVALDRQDTIVRNVSLNNPLEFTVSSVKDVCEGVSNNSGAIRFGQVRGGQPYSTVLTGWWTYQTRFVNTSGQQVQGTWHVNGNDPNWQHNQAGLTAGTYIVEVEDGSGCKVQQQVVINSQPSNTYFISTTGSDSALGTAANPLKTISEALTRACDGDTIILEDGRHFENVIISSESPKLTIGSRYLLDGDTNHIRNAIVDGMDLNPVFSINTNNQGVTDTVRLNGFTVTNGLANSGWNGGGGISIRWSNASVTNMRIVENRSGQNGGGMGVWESQIKMKNVLIKDNFATNQGGGLHLQYINNDLIQSNVRIVGNRANEGGGLYYARDLGQQGQLYELDGFQIINNYATGSGGGVYINCWSGSADLQLSNSKIIGNVAGNDAGAIYVQTTNADVNFVNLIVARNEANHAGAIKVNNSKLNLIHSTLYQNRHKLGSTSSVTNLAIQIENQSTLKMYNSILGGQGAGGKTVNITDNPSSFEVVSGQLGGGASTVQSVSGSTVTIVPTSLNYTDQLIFLKDPSGGDYGLTSVSQALGRGLAAFPTGIVMPLTDIYGNTRPNSLNSNPDLGAIESNETAPTFGVAFVVSDNNACNTSIGQITAHPQNGSGVYTYSWTALTSGGIITNPTGAGASHTIANLFSGLYRVIVTDIGVTPNQVDTAIAEVRGDATLTINKTVKNEGCQGASDGSFDVSVSGGSGFYTYTWLKPNGTTANTKNLLNLSPGIYSITVTDNKGCSVSKTDTVGTSFAKPVITVTSQILKAGGTTITGGNDVRMCIGDQVVFNAGSGYDYYEWNKADGLNAEYSQTVSTLVSQTYSVYVEDTNGCSTAGIAKVFVVYQPNVYASNVNRTMGQQFQQVTSYVRGDTSAVSGTINSNLSPYNAQMGSGQKRMQFVLSASELQGAGLTENTTINSLAFDVVNPNGVAVQAYKLKLAHTTSQQLGTWQSPLNQTETFAIPVYSPVQGWNTHNFSNSFAWNGVDNLLVEVCYLPVAGSMSSATVRVNQVNTANTLTNFSYSATSCSGPVGQMGSSNWRPTVRFGIDKVEVLDTVRVCDFTTLNTTDDYDTYTWYVNGVANTTAGLSLNLTTPANVYLAATDAASNCVMRSDTFYVALDATPNVVATSSITGAVCAGDTVELGTTSLGLASYAWSNGDSSMTTNVFESGTYVLQARSINGCAGDDTVVVAVNTPPTVVVKLNGKTLTATDGTLASKASACVQSVLLPVNENFEDSLYIWTQSTTDQLDWTLNSGVTNTQFSGPNGDYTTADSSGNYYYLDRAGANSDDNKEAHLLSPCIQLVGAEKPYLAFGYHMFNGLYNSANPAADNMGTLRIEVQTTDDAANYWLPLWTKTGHQGAGWKDDTLNLTAFAGKTIRLRIVGKAGVGGPRSEMAIDGFSIVDTANAFANVAGRISADIICEGDVLIADAISNGSNDFDYLWSTGDTTSSIKVDTTGYYFVTVLDENGCSISTDSIWINVSPIPNRQMTVTGDLNNCYNESVAVTVQAPVSYDAYTWFGDTALTPNNAITTLVSLQGLGIGQYRLGVRIVDSIGCAAISDTLKINRFVQPTITSVVVPVACYGDSTGSITVTPASGIYSYDWSNGDSTSTSSDLWAANYSVIFTDVHGCLDTTSITVGQPNPLAVSFVNANTQPVSCFGGSNGSIWPTVVGGNGSYQYSWTGPNGFSSTASSLTNRVSGAYVLSVVDLKGCSIQDTHFVTQPSLLDATLDSASNVKCFQTPTGWISVDVSGGNGGNILNWKNSTGQIIASGDSIAGLLAGSYRFVVTDMKGCKDSLTHVITQPQLLDLTSNKTQFSGGINVRCYGDNSGAITTNTVGGTLPYQWLWSNSSTTSAIDSLVSGTYSVTVTDAKGCKDSALIVLTQPTALIVNATASDVLCNSDQTGSVSVSSSGSISPYWLDWNTTGVDSSLSRITLVLDLRSASSIATPTVAVVGVSTNIPMVSYNGDSIYYATIERKPGIPIYYRFYNGSTPELVPVSCGVNPPSLTDLHRLFTAGVNDTTLNAVCFASCVNCFGQQAGARSKALVSNNVTISNQGSGVVSWSIVDANGCLVSGQDTINQPLPIAIQLDTIIDVSCPQAGDGSILITISGGVAPYDFDWSNGDTIEDLLNEDEGPYQVVLSDNNGCVDSAQFVLGAPQPYNFEEVCMLTVDSLTGKNQVVWNKTSGKQTMEYQIFKETNVAGQYAQIGTVPYLNMSVFTDVNSVPQQQPDRYKIAVVDSCGNVSDTSDLHRTIHLQSSFGSSGEVNLSWTQYEGRAVQTYEIYRWISAGNLVQIGSVSGASNTFSDLNPPVAPIVNYNVRAIFSGDVCAPAVGKTSSYESARSNILDQTGIGMPDLPWKGLARMFPNPTNAVVRVEVPEAGFVIRITNLLGQVIHQVMVQEQAINIDLAHVAAGMYQVELYREGQVMSIDKLHVVH